MAYTEKDYKKYNWDLESLLQGKTLDALFNLWIKKNDEMVKMFPTFCDNLNNFKKWHQVDDELDKISNRLSNYISNKMSEDVSDQEYLSWEQKISMKSHEYSQKFATLSNVIIKNEKKIKSYLTDKALVKYTKAYERTLRYKPHILSEEVNKAISKISINNGAVGSVFSTLVDEDIKIPDALDKNNKPIAIPTQSKVHELLKSEDRVLRKNVWINYHKSFNNFTSTLAQLLYYNYLKLNTYAKLKNYPDYVSKTAFDDEIKVDLILNLYKYVASFKESYKNYRQIFSALLKEKLKLKDLEPWDMSVDLTKVKLEYSIEQAKKMVLDVVNIFGSEYVNITNKAFNEKWISWLPKPRKYSGAYSIGGTKGLDKYYILMNFNGSYDSVSTLIHELGHSLNSYYFTNYNPDYANTTIFTAEIPSIVNETLLSEYVINNNKNNKELVVNFITEFLANFFNTTSRQIIFSEFEYKANDLVNNSQPFTKESLKKIYHELVDKYLGVKDPKKALSEPYAFSLSTCMRIPHFYAGNFYVYKYAIGQIVAINVVNRILSKEPGFMEKYFKFLKSGTSLNPIETIKILDIDLNKKETYDQAIKFVNDKINLLKTYAPKTSVTTKKVVNKKK